MSDMELIQRLRGRAAYLRDIGRVKSPQVMEQAAAELTELRAIMARLREPVSDGNMCASLGARLDAGSGAEVRAYVITCDPFHSREDVMRAALNAYRQRILGETE